MLAEGRLKNIMAIRPGRAQRELDFDRAWQQRGSSMTLTQGSFQAYDFDRMVVLFTMKNDQADVPCAISTDAMDDLEGSSRTSSAEREQQFLRLRDRIEERAARKFMRAEFEGSPPGIVLRRIDFRSPYS
jgi:hypothetical protein